MGADIWLGRLDRPMGYFRDSYGNGLTTLNYLGLSYWQDPRPLLDADGTFPLERNAWLLGELRRRVAERNLRGVPTLLVDVWYEHYRLAGA